MNILIFIISILTFIVICKRFGLASFVAAGYAGLFIYSIPVFINKARYFYYLNSEFHLYSPSFEAMLVYLLVWVVFLCLVLLKSNNLYKVNSFNQSTYLLSKIFLYVGFILSISIYIYSTFVHSQQVLVEGTQMSTIILLIGRWIYALTFISSIIHKSFIPFIVLFYFLIDWALGGDRTLFGIVMMSSIVVAIQLKYNSTYVPFKYLFKMKIFSALFLVIFIIIFGKSIFVSIDTENWSVFFNLFSENNLVDFLSTSFEPMIIFNHIQHVIDRSVEMSLIDFMVSILSNLLIFPSAFGLNSNFYSQMLISSLEIEMSYGVAGNYWAHAYSVLGYIGIFIFALIYVNFLFFCDNFFLKKRGAARVLIALFGGLVSLYAHRNGFDNLLSFVRQILLAYFLIVSLSFFVKIIIAFFKKKIF